MATGSWSGASAAVVLADAVSPGAVLPLVVEVLGGGAVTDGASTPQPEPTGAKPPPGQVMFWAVGRAACALALVVLLDVVAVVALAAAVHWGVVAVVGQACSPPVEAQVLPLAQVITPLEQDWPADSTRPTQEPVPPAQLPWAPKSPVPQPLEMPQLLAKRVVVPQP